MSGKNHNLIKPAFTSATGKTKRRSVWEKQVALHDLRRSVLQQSDIRPENYGRFQIVQQVAWIRLPWSFE